jgi:hypothetical protein
MGMTLRQDAAIKILAGLVSNPAVIAQDFREGWTLVNCSENYIAGYAIKLADALIERLEEE